MSLVLRNTKGSELTFSEVDGNFTYLDNKIENISIPPAGGVKQISETGKNGTSTGWCFTSDTRVNKYTIGENATDFSVIMSIVKISNARGGAM